MKRLLSKSSHFTSKNVFFFMSFNQSINLLTILARLSTTKQKNLFLYFIKPISLGLLRSDIMLESICAEDCSCPRSYCCWKQVEINTIASGFGHLGPISKELQRSHNKFVFTKKFIFIFFLISYESIFSFFWN